MTLNFDKYAQTGKIFVKRIAQELGNEEDLARAARILRATLHVLRNQSTPEESVQFISQLPMFIKAIYVDGWVLGSKKNRVRHVEDFVAAVSDQVGAEAFKDPEDCLVAIKDVLRVVREHVSDGEINDIKCTMPAGLRSLLDD